MSSCVRQGQVKGSNCGVTCDRSRSKGNQWREPLISLFMGCYFQSPCLRLLSVTKIDWLTTQQARDIEAMLVQC